MPFAPLVALLAFSAAAGSQQDSPQPQPSGGPAPVLRLAQRSLRAARRVGPITLDGKMDEPAWLAAELGTAFRQTEPDEGKPASEPTRFRILWDEEFLYVGVECDDPQEPNARLSRRDRFLDTDRISFDFDTTLDRRTSYHFQVYASGQQLDGLHFDDTNLTTDWDAAWESKVVRTKTGWSFEAKIPLRAMRIPVGAKEFGFNIFRYLTRRHEESEWKFVPKGTAGDVSLLGRLTGLDGIQPVRTLELRPYVAARAVRTVPVLGPVAAGFAFDGCASAGVTRAGVAAACAGIDMRIGLTSDLALVATINPDFGQVEADERVLNLTTFETFYPEKRPFFLEGMELYQTPVQLGMGGPYGGDAFQLFYSRRIGRPTSLPDPLPDGTTSIFTPSARPVVSALKLSGLVGSGTVGLLSSIEPRVDTQLVGNDQQITNLRIAEAQHSAVGRFRVPIGSHALAGVTATALDPLFAGNARHAHTGGADLALFDADRDWNFQSQFAGSLLSGGPSEVQRDGTVLGAGSSGYAASARISKEGGDTNIILDADYLSPQFTTNELGFLRRANLFRSIFLYKIRDVHPGPSWQNASLALFGRHIRNAGMDVPLETDIGLETNITFNNYWSVYGGLLTGPPGYDDRELLDGTPFERPGGVTVYASVNTDGRRDVALSGSGSYFRSTDNQASSSSLGLNATLRPLPQLEAQVGLGVSLGQNDLRSIRGATAPAGPGVDPTVVLDPATATQQGRVYLFAPQNSRAGSATLRGTFSFSPALTLQAYAQLFAAGVSYGGALRAVAQPGRQRIHFGDLAPALPEDAAPNADDRQAGLNVNLILRWEWALGSTLYLVYAHATANELTPTARGLDFRGELGAIGQTGAVHGDTVLVKVDLLKAL